MSAEKSNAMRVCVVGAGAAGLCAARHLVGDSKFDFVVYEQTNGIGGTWVYETRTDRDENGLPIHSSMYWNLRTNLPSKIMNFPDFMRMSSEERSCPSHADILAYLHDYSRHYNLAKHIRFETKVERISCTSTGKWLVRVRDVKTHATDSREFDAIIVCNGHYFEPRVPRIDGIESFPGKVLHSHCYRVPENFAGRTVFILGAATSGIDIALDLSAHASRIYLGHEHDRIDEHLSENITQVVGIERIEGKRVSLRDGSSVTVDDLIYCTGYRYSFPFLDETCGVRVEESHVTPLYRHLINIEHPTMCFVGIPTNVLPFPMFHMQVQYFLNMLKAGRLSLLDKSTMLKDSTTNKTGGIKYPHKLMERQWEYNDELAATGGFAPLPDIYKTGYVAWHGWKEGNLRDYKNSKFTVEDDRVRVLPLQN